MSSVGYGPTWPIRGSRPGCGGGWSGSVTAPCRRCCGRGRHGDLWVAIEGRWLVDPAVSFADRELELASMQLSGNLPPELFEAHNDEWPPDPSYEQRRPALQLHKFLNNIRHFGPDRYVPRIEAILGAYGW
jgi:hypothetical protein